MAANIELSLIVPAYNEARSILGTLRDFQAYLDRRPFAYEIIVAADGDDGTRELVGGLAARDPRVSVLGGPGRGGKGRGIRRGVARARGRVVGFADADNKTPIEELEKVLPWLDRGFDVVIGSRGLAESRIETPQPLYRRLGSRAFALGMHLVLGLWSVRDTQCGFKFFRGPVARDLFARQRIDGYMFDIEVLHLAERAGYRIKEVGVRWRDDGDSRLQLVSGNWRNLLDVFRVRFGQYPPPLPGAAAGAAVEKLVA
jgi:glycosyltransferase involved in cell wall biosynthesis